LEAATWMWAAGMERKEVNPMNASGFAQMNVTPLLTLGELGLERRVTVEEAGNALARIAEAQVVRWVQFPAGVLFFTLVSCDPESGALYVLDRKTGIFYWLDFDDRKWGGYSLADYSALVRKHKLTTLARRPRLLAQRCRPPAVA
jgi:hypothetical protein